MAKSKNPRLCQLTTPFEKDTTLSWQKEYPRPQLKRQNWQSLCGPWQLSVKAPNGTVTALGDITVPYPPESRISGIMRPLAEDEQYIYEKTFVLDNTYADKKVLLHFGAVDTHCTVFVNGKKVGEHKGGYLPFTFDITSFVLDGENDLSMLALGHSIAMGNALDTVKAQCEFVTDTNEEDGIANFIEKHL